MVLGLLGNWVNIFERVSSTLESTLYKSNLGFQYSIKGIKFLFLGVARIPCNEKKCRFMWDGLQLFFTTFSVYVASLEYI